MPVEASDLRRVREQAGLSQVDLAARLGMTPSQLSRLESGARRIHLKLINEWLEACGYRLAAVGPEHEALMKEIATLGATPHMARVRRLARLLPTLDPAHQLTLDALLASWEQAACSALGVDPKAARRG